MHTRWMRVVVMGLGSLGLPLGAMADEVPATNQHAAARSAQHVPAGEQPDLTLLDRLASTYTTPKAVATFLRNNFTFTRDEDLFGEPDRWQSPEEFASRKVGDCEDFALLAQALLRRNGIEAYLLSVFGEGGYAHTVCVFVDERGRYNVIDVGKIRYPHAKSLNTLASWLYPAWTVGGIAEQDGAHGRLVKSLTNPYPASLIALANPVTAFQF